MVSIRSGTIWEEGPTDHSFSYLHHAIFQLFQWTFEDLRQYIYYFIVYYIVFIQQQHFGPISYNEFEPALIYGYPNKGFP